ncbi:MAG: M48 family metalloprotease [Armatimonadota bacterium]
MRLTVADYRHPAELPALVAGLWLAATLLLAAHVLAIWLIIAHPLNPWAASALGLIILLVLDLGLALGLTRIRPYLTDLRASARTVGPTSFPRVHEAAELVARRLGLPATPPVFLLPVEQLDSFAVGIQRPELYVSEGLVEELNRLALRAALAHEMGHIKARHVLLATLVLLPLRAGLVHWLLLTPFALAAVALRGWVRAAELSADRAATVAAGGAEPLAHWLSAAVEQSPDASSTDLHHYLTYGVDELDRAFAEAELHLTHPTIGRRIIEAARFVRSRRFANCLAIVGDLRLPVADNPPDPALAGVLPFVTIGALAGLWLAPLTIAITLALGSPATPPVQTPAAPSETFDPNLAPPPTGGEGEAIVNVPVAEGVTVQDDVRGLLEVAEMHKDHGNLPAARQALEQVLLRDPTIAEAHFMLAWVHAANNDRDLAAEEFNATINLTEPGSEMHEEAAAALERLGYGD